MAGFHGIEADADIDQEQNTLVEIPPFRRRVGSGFGFKLGVNRPMIGCDEFLDDPMFCDHLWKPTQDNEVDLGAICRR